MTVRTLDRAVLMRHATIVAGRVHPVMGAERVITPGQILARLPVQVAKRRRETVAAMFARRATQRPQGVLQSFSQRDIAFAAEIDMSVLEPGVYEPEVVETVIERFGGDRDAQFGHDLLTVSVVSVSRPSSHKVVVMCRTGTGSMVASTIGSVSTRGEEYHDCPSLRSLTTTASASSFVGQ